MRVLAFEDHYDIEAMLTAGGVNTNGMAITPAMELRGGPETHSGLCP